MLSYAGDWLNVVLFSAIDLHLLMTNFTHASIVGWKMFVKKEKKALFALLLQTVLAITMWGVEVVRTVLINTTQSVMMSSLQLKQLL